MNEVVTQGTDIFSFDDPAVESDLKVQQWFGFQAAINDRPGCGDQAHEDRDGGVFGSVSGAWCDSLNCHLHVGCTPS